MLHDSERDLIVARVAAIVTECSKDFAVAEQRLREEYRDRSEHLEYALYWLKDVQTSPSPDEAPQPRGVVWKRILKNDALSEFRNIEPIEKQHYSSRYFKGWAKHTPTALFIKYLRDCEDTTEARRTADVIREYQQYFKLDDPNIVRVCDVGWVRDENGSEFPFVATEYLEGANLKEWLLTSKNHPTLKESAEIIRVIAATLQRVIHEVESEATLTDPEGLKPKGMHLDLKPDNVMVKSSNGVLGKADKGSIRLVDFGASELGTPGYRAPEVYKDNKDRPSPHATWDIFSLGAILYFLVKRTAPDQANPAFVSAGDWNTWVAKINLGDSDLNLICRKCLAYNPSERYQLPQHLEEDLSDWLNDRPLRHVRKDGYIWQEKWTLLKKRCRERNDVEDHAQVVALAAVVTGVIASANGITHAAQVFAGTSPELASERANLPTLASCFLVFVYVMHTIRWKWNSVKIFAPLCAFVLTCVVSNYVLIPGTPFSAPNWHEQNIAAVSAMMIVSVLLICIGSQSPEWRRLFPFGWMVLASGLCLRNLFESRFSDYAMPVVVSAIEATACFLFASQLWSMPIPPLNETTQPGIS